MDSFEINKVLGALLGTCLVLVAMHIASGAIFTPEPPAKPGYIIAVKEEQPAGGAAPAAPAEAADRDGARKRIVGARRTDRQTMPSLP